MTKKKKKKRRRSNIAIAIFTNYDTILVQKLEWIQKYRHYLLLERPGIWFCCCCARKVQCCCVRKVQSSRIVMMPDEFILPRSNGKRIVRIASISSFLRFARMTLTFHFCFFRFESIKMSVERERASMGSQASISSGNSFVIINWNRVVISCMPSIPSMYALYPKRYFFI